MSDISVDVHSEPTPSSIRFGATALAILLLAIQVGAAIWAYSEWYRTDVNNVTEMNQVWHRFTVALGNALTATLTLVTIVGMVLGAHWAWRTLGMAACLQIVITLITQIMEADIQPPSQALPQRAILNAILGIVAWNIVPVAVLVFSLTGSRRITAAPKP